MKYILNNKVAYKKHRFVSLKILMVVISIIALCGIVVFGYALLNSKVVELRYKIVELSNIKNQLLENSKKLKIEILTLTDVERLKAMAAKNFKLGEPSKDKIIHK